MSNLIPEQRADKNGKTVTRWIKPDGSTSKRKNIPAPKSDSPQDLLFYELSRSVDLSISDHGINKADVIEKARRLPPRTAQLLLDLRAQNSDLYTVENIIVSALHKNATPEMLGNIALVYNEFQYTDMEWEHESHSSYGYITANIRGLSMYPQFSGITNFAKHGEEIKAKARSLTALVYHGEGYSGVMQSTDTHEGVAYHFRNPEFVQLALDHSETEESAQDFVDLVYSKGCDPDVLKEILATTVPLREGVL